MKFVIKNIILFPKNGLKNKRIVSFETDKVNVITGESHKGKSALVHIIDYCLGSGKCSIPVGEIRNKTSWFGVHIKTEKTEILLLRKEPGSNLSTDEMILMEQVEAIDLENLEKAENFRTNRNYVKNRLNQLSELSSERIDQENVLSGFGAAASFRDTAAFQFQPQHIVANPYALFFKADTYEHQQKLKTVFPLFIGAISNKAVSLEREIKTAEGLLRKDQLELQTKKRAINSWKGDLMGLFTRAIQLGLVKEVPLNSDSFDTEQYLHQLSLVQEYFAKNPIPLYQSGASEKDAQQQFELNQQERTLLNDIFFLKTRLSKLQSLTVSSSEYKETIKTHQNRLQPIGWFSDRINNDKCPFCKSKNETTADQIKTLKEYEEKLVVISKAVNSSDVNLDKEMADMKKELKDMESRVNDIRQIKRGIYKRSSAENGKRQTIEEIYKFIGKLEQALESVVSTSIDSALLLRIEKIESDIESLKENLKGLKEKYNKDNILRKISISMSHYVKLLDIERPNDPVELDIENLTVKILSQTNSRKDYLWEVGSGANWMGYHLSSLFALHEHFLSLKKSFVPSFLLIDQPSQVYFPKEIPQEYLSADVISEDLLQTRKIFQAASDCIKRTKGNLQIIIVEHAPEITWKGVNNIHLVEEWRGDNALIPKEWFE